MPNRQSQGNAERPEFGMAKIGNCRIGSGAIENTNKFMALVRLNRSGT
jgi:hypothetical protein